MTHESEEHDYHAKHLKCDCEERCNVSAASSAPARTALTHRISDMQGDFTPRAEVFEYRRGMSGLSECHMWQTWRLEQTTGSSRRLPSITYCAKKKFIHLQQACFFPPASISMN